MLVPSYVLYFLFNYLLFLQVPSLPIVSEETPDHTNSQVYAQWPGGQKKDDESTSSTFLQSSVTLMRTVRRVRNFDNLSNGTTADDSQIKEPKEADSKRFLSSLSKAFAPELLDLQVGLLRGSSEIIPLGVATVVIPGEPKCMELDIPVVRNYYVGKHASLSKKKISQLRGKANTSKDHVYFSAEKETKYKVNEGAFLRLQLNIEPAVVSGAPVASFPSFHLNNKTRKTDFRAGPINQALRRRQKMDQLMSLEKLPLHQRIQLYLELRSRKGGSSSKVPTPSSKDVFVGKQSEISEVSCEVPHHVDDASEADDASAASFKIDQYGDGDASVASVHSNASATLSLQQKEVQTLLLDAIAEGQSSASQGAVARADISNQPKDELSVSVASLLAKGHESQDSYHDGDGTQFSSSLYSVFNTNHPQKDTAAQNMIDLLVCDANLILGEEERNALKYYAQKQEEALGQYLMPFSKYTREHEDKCVHYCGLDEEFSIQESCGDEDFSLASLDSTSIMMDKVGKKGRKAKTK